MLQTDDLLFLAFRAISLSSARQTKSLCSSYYRPKGMAACGLPFSLLPPLSMIPLQETNHLNRVRLNTHGGTGLRFCQSPLPELRACCSSVRSSRLRQYFRYTHANPALTSSRLTQISRPSSLLTYTHPTARPYRSQSTTWTRTLLPKTRELVNCFARFPKGCRLSGQSMQARRILTCRFAGVRMVMVSPSATLMQRPLRVSAAEVATRSVTSMAVMRLLIAFCPTGVK